MAENIKIAKGQHLADVMDQIPSNVILNKQITGCGATTLEINAARNSIIIEPNVPVIVGKASKHPNVFPVYEKVTFEDVEAYLQKQIDGYRKIVTTPEGYDKKVKPALSKHIKNYKESFFLLFDECEKIIQDVDYRGDIYLPVDDFFSFSSKAMVSATPIIPRDPRFEEQGFTICKVMPDYDFRHKVNLRITNNTVVILRELLKHRKSEICIFINSTDTIHRIIRTLGLQDNCKVFCSEKSVKKLRAQGFMNAEQNLQDLADVNFFTSRFYSAVDIELEYKPTVVLLTDVIHAPFSSIDPATEVIQAIGRFRQGVKDVWHISNTNPGMPYYSGSQLEAKLQSQENVYLQVARIAPQNGWEHDAKQNALNGMPYKRFVTTSGNKNYFMWDNAHDDERIKYYYTNASRLIEAYNRAPLIVNTKEWYRTLTDSDRLHRESETITKPKRWQTIIDQVQRLKDSSDGKISEEDITNELGVQFKDMVHAIRVIGPKRIEILKYNDRQIVDDVKKTEHFSLVRKELKESVYELYAEGMTEKVDEVNAMMKILLEEREITPIGRVDRRYVELFFEIEDSKIKGIRHFRFIRRTLK